MTFEESIVTVFDLTVPVASYTSSTWLTATFSTLAPVTTGGFSAAASCFFPQDTARTAIIVSAVNIAIFDFISDPLKA
ncbi:MAG: hypothetical protein IPO77_16935 [Acidobacteria bacterium]|nr:hypothetical protein [Acidobacteriota bacterium]